jgi:hypothetical protein
MQARTEDTAWSFKAFKERLRDWEIRHLKTARFLEYFLFFGLVLFCTLYGFAQLNLIHTEPTSALYMLSALVQTQAAIVAIVVSMTLIAVQFAASAYSPRVIRIFLKNPDMWYLLCFYGFSIFLGLLVLKMIRGGEDSTQIVLFYNSLEYSIIFIYALGVASFAILFLYLDNTINLLDPENIIKRLQIEITKNKLIDSEEDPIQPIMDIVHGSIMKYDIATTRVGLKAVADKVIEIIDSKTEKETSELFCNHLERVGRLAISKLDEEATMEVIHNLEKFGKISAERRLGDATSRAAKALGDVGATVAKEGLEDTTKQISWSLRDIGETAAKEGLEDATSLTAESLGVFGITAAEEGLEQVTWMVALYLRDIGKIAAEKGLRDATSIVAEMLGDVGKIAAEKGLKDATSRVAWSLGSVGRKVVEKGKEFEVVIEQVVQSFVKTGVSAVENGLNEVALEIAKFLAELLISSEGIVKTEPQHYVSLEGKNREVSQRFIKLYEQELAKLRA